VETELDHVFVMCGANAPEASALSSLGLKEGSSNTHPGQGTACRRYFFRNAYLELLWVCDPAEAQNELTSRTRLWERWSARQEGACPFGLVLRPSSDDATARPPFPTWSYTPAYLPTGFAIETALDTPLTEPEFFFVGFRRGGAQVEGEPIQHAIAVEQITGLRIGTPAAGPCSGAARWAESIGLLWFEASDDYVLNVTFDDGIKGRQADLRPGLPLVLRW
jgi:Glyoxalase-like domain